jgi:hypothetical protein
MSKREVFGKYYICLIFLFWFGTEVLLGSRLEKILFWNIKDVNDHLAIIVLGLLVVQIVAFQQYTIRELAVIGLLSLPILYATINSDHNIMMSTWLFIIAVKYVDFDMIARFAYYVELVATIIVIYLFSIGAITEYSMYRDSVLRHSLGFSHPNQLGVRIFLLIIVRCYVHRKKFNLFDWSLIVLAALFVNSVANSKTSCYALIILAVIMAIYEVIKLFGGNLEKYSNAMILISVCAIVSSVVLSVINVKKIPLLREFDQFMSLRFSQSHRTMQYYGIKLFGQNVRLIFSRPGIGKTYHFWLDNAYMSILLRYGIVVFLIFSVLYIWTMIFLKKEGQHILVAILCLYSIYGIMENNFFYMSQNLFLLLLSYPIYGHIETNENDSMEPVSRFRLSW